MDNGNTVINAVFARYEAKRLDALARLQIYSSNPAGVGDHSNVVEEAASALGDLDSALSALQTLSGLVTPPPTNENN